MPKNTENTTTCRMSPVAIASKMDVGNRWIRISHPVCGLVASEATAAAPSAGSEMPAPGWNQFTRPRPRNSATVVASSKKMSAFTAMRPIAFMSPVPAMPMTSVENSNGAMIILIIRRKTVDSGLSCSAKPITCRPPASEEGKKYPRTMPRMRPMKIWVVTLGMRERRWVTAAAESSVVRKAIIGP